MKVFTAILSFLETFNLRKTNPQFFNISENLIENQRKKQFLVYSEPLKVSYAWYTPLLKLKCFFLTLIVVSYIFCIIFTTLFYFTFFFLLCLPRETLYNLLWLIRFHYNPHLNSIQYLKQKFLTKLPAFQNKKRNKEKQLPQSFLKKLFHIRFLPHPYNTKILVKYW